MDVLIATVNEDANSAIDLIYPAIGAVATYAYSPSPEVSGNGGTDSIAILGGAIYLSHSNPPDNTQATDYKVTFDSSSTALTANLTPVFYYNGAATDSFTGASVTLNLGDPDTNFAMPSE